MKPRFSLKYLIAFFALLFVMHELHDWAHAITGRIFCDCWGTKGFDTWNFCDKCNLTTFETFCCWIAGPLISYLFLWMGYWLMHPYNGGSDKSLGFSIYFAALPLARIIPVFSGSGDEVNGFAQLIAAPHRGNNYLVTLLAVVLILLMTIPGLIRAARLLANWNQILLVISGALVLPYLVEMLVVNGLMSKILSKGILEEEGLPGTPILVTIWVFLMILTLMITYKKLLHIFKRRKKKKEDIFSSTVEA